MQEISLSTAVGQGGSNSLSCLSLMGHSNTRKSGACLGSKCFGQYGTNQVPFRSECPTPVGGQKPGDRSAILHGAEQPPAKVCIKVSHFCRRVTPELNCHKGLDESVTIRTLTTYRARPLALLCPLDRSRSSNSPGATSSTSQSVSSISLSK